MYLESSAAGFSAAGAAGAGAGPDRTGMAGAGPIHRRGSGALSLYLGRG